MPRSFNREARKAQLAEAVWQVILDQGVSAVSIRTVAKQAGVVVGSLRHVFPTRAMLIAYSAELMVQRATERTLAIPPNDDPRKRILDMIKSLMPFEPESRAEFEVNIALYAEWATVPEIITIRNQAHQQLAMGVIRMVEVLTGTSATPELLAEARRLHALIDGVALHMFHQPADSDNSWAIAIIENELERISSGGDTENRTPVISLED